MNSHTRRAIAIISTSVANKKIFSSVNDYEEGRYFNFSGEISETNLNLYDYEKSCYITGSTNAETFSLYHYGNAKHIDLKIKDNKFEGNDFDSGKHYSSDVNGGINFTL